MYVIFDLDGTLALNGHREHFIKRDKPDWDAFFEACGDDEPNWPIINTLKVMHQTCHVEIWSGRSAAVRGKTEAWLELYGIRHELLINMRMVGDYTPDDVLKERWLLEPTGIKPDLVFDDRDKVVAMWRRNNIACCQVAPGNF